MASNVTPNIISDLLQEFCSITGASTEIGNHYLEACGNNLESAVEMFLESAPGPSSISYTNYTRPGIHDYSQPSTCGRANNDVYEDSIRPPIPQKKETLIEEGERFSFGRRKVQKVVSVFDAFRDFQEEARQYEELNSNVSPSISSGTLAIVEPISMFGMPVGKKKTLEDLFRPPLDLIFKGNFLAVKESCVQKNKWLLVNVQNVKEFSCQVLNRDVWSDNRVKETVKKNFVLWQVYSDSGEGIKYMQFYKVDKWPYIAFLDPRTGEKLLECHTLDAKSFGQIAEEFLSIHRDPNEETDKSSSPPAKRRKTILDASEDSQLEAAISASLFEEEKIIITNDNNGGCEGGASKRNNSNNNGNGERRTSVHRSFNSRRSRSDNDEEEEQQEGEQQEMEDDGYEVESYDDDCCIDDDDDDGDLETFSDADDDDGGGAGGPMDNRGKNENGGNDRITTGKRKSTSIMYEDDESTSPKKPQMSFFDPSSRKSGLMNDCRLSQSDDARNSSGIKNSCSNDRDIASVIKKTNSNDNDIASVVKRTHSNDNDSESAIKNTNPDDSNSTSVIKNSYSNDRDSASGIKKTYLKDRDIASVIKNSIDAPSTVSGIKIVSSDDIPGNSVLLEPETKNTKTPEDMSYKKYLGPDSDEPCHIILRFPNGDRTMLSWPHSSKLMALFAYVNEHGFNLDDYELLTTYPRRVIDVENSTLSTTLKEAKLFPKETVFLQLKLTR